MQKFSISVTLLKWALLQNKEAGLGSTFLVLLIYAFHFLFSNTLRFIFSGLEEAEIVVMT